LSGKKLKRTSFYAKLTYWFDWSIDPRPRYEFERALGIPGLGPSAAWQRWPCRWLLFPSTWLASRQQLTGFTDGFRSAFTRSRYRYLFLWWLPRSHPFSS